jgi:hypothetical protein
MTKPSTPTDPAGSGQDWPRTLNEAVDRLARMLSHTEKEEIAALTEGDLIGLHFGPGMRIRNEFSLWHDNSCRGLKSKTVRTAISAISGLDYVQLSEGSGLNYLQLSLKSAAQDRIHPIEDHIICN